MELISDDVLQYTLSFIGNESYKLQFICKLWKKLIKNYKKQLNKKYPIEEICPPFARLPSKNGIEIVFVIDPSRSALSEKEKLKLYQGPFVDPKQAWRHFSDLCAEMDKNGIHIWWERPVKFLLYDGMYSTDSIGDIRNGQVDGIQWIGIGNDVIMVSPGHSEHLCFIQDTYFENIKFIHYYEKPFQMDIWNFEKPFQMDGQKKAAQLTMKNCGFRFNYYDPKKPMIVSGQTNNSPKARLINCLFTCCNYPSDLNIIVSDDLVDIEMIECEFIKGKFYSLSLSCIEIIQLKRKMQELEQNQKE
eukprot:348673_1